MWWLLACVESPDIDSEPAVDSQPVVVNSPPTVTVELSPDPAFGGDALSCEAETDDADGDGVTVDVQIAGGADPQSVQKGETWTCTATADDGTDQTVATDELTVGNSPPALLSLRITPSEPVAQDDLLCEAEVEDPDGETLTLTLAWTSGDRSVEGATLTADNTAVGETWTCTATVSDGDAEETRGTSVDIGCSPGTQDCPGVSCFELRQQGVTSDGAYWIDPTGAAPFQAWCDMDTDGGGWTLLTNVTADYASDGFDYALDGNWVGDDDHSQALTAVASEIRYQCQASTGTLTDVKTDSSVWLERTYSTGNACSVGYNWLPDMTHFEELEDATYTPRDGYDGVSCCCRPDHRLHTYHIGFNVYDWLINDLYYDNWERLCGGEFDADWHRIWIR